MSWFDNTSVNLLSYSAGVEPTHSGIRYDRSQRKKFQVTQPNIMRVYNQYMGGVDKLDIMCALYKPSLRTRPRYIFIWLHSILIAAINAWFRYRYGLKVSKPNGKFIQLKRFLADLAESLVKTVRPVGRPFLDEFQPPQKKQLRFKEIQQKMFKKIASDTCQFTMKKGSVAYIVRYRFTMSAAKDAMFGFV